MAPDPPLPCIEMEKIAILLFPQVDQPVIHMTMVQKRMELQVEWYCECQNLVSKSQSLSSLEAMLEVVIKVMLDFLMKYAMRLQQ